MSDVTLLRTMTKKSRIKFGRYADMTVGSLLIESPIKLVAMYYNLAAITFTEDILNELMIERRIDKPGRLSYEEGDALTREVSTAQREQHKLKVGEEAYMREVNAKRANMRRNRSGRVRGYNLTNSKANNARRNHGHGAK